MKPLFVLALFLSVAPALADGGVTVPLPRIPPLSTGEQEHLLMQLVTANVVGENCAGYSLTPEEFALVTGSADLVARSLGLWDSDAYDDRFYRPAFAMLDKPQTCDREGPRIRPLINRLIAWGGSLTPQP
ncbi:MAG: hypothetical protein H6899_15720 [Rhodobacter sp.]|nr:hypothetical protein [Paracoccaceae bacterium]MCC0081365.1 hypothetical protein [Rhodobacter sp.]